MEYQDIVLTREEPIAVIQLNRPKVLNALRSQLMAELADAISALDADPAIRCIVLTGNERAFAAGADIGEFQGVDSTGMYVRDRFVNWRRIQACRKPIIAAVSGFCLGGGNELAMICDIIIASESAQFGQPEINLGLIPGAGGTQRLPRAVGKSIAMEMVLTGRFLPAQRAYQLGLVSKVVPVEFYLEEAKTLAREIAAKAPVAVIAAKSAVLKSFNTAVQDGMDYEARLFEMLFSTEDKAEGVDAFLNKRKPNFQGR